MRIASWNVERPSSQLNDRTRRILNKLQEISADVWILTETHDNIQPGPEHQVVSTPTIDTEPFFHRDGEHMTSIWSYWPIIRSYETATPHRSICVTLKVPRGALVVYGTVLPYHGARWVYGTARNWDAHYAAIATQGADWIRIRREYPTTGLCVAGDFNQNRPVRKNYGTQWGIQLLDLALQESHMTGITQVDFPTASQLSAGDLELVKNNIDHICLKREWVNFETGFGVWPNICDTGEQLSDCNGVFVDLDVD